MTLRTSDRSYHEARALDELQRAEEASDPAIARIHRELAALHRRQMLRVVEVVYQPAPMAFPRALRAR